MNLFDLDFIYIDADYMIFPNQKRPGCRGRRIESLNGADYDCDYEFADEFGCEDCVYGPYPDESSLDPETGKRTNGS